MDEQNKPEVVTPTKERHPGSKITNAEWALVIFAGILIDLTQVILDIFLVGVFANPFIDIFVGMTLPFYYKIRGVRMDWKKSGVLGLSFLFEFLGVGWLDSAPLWTLDIIITMLWDKADKEWGKHAK